MPRGKIKTCLIVSFAILSFELLISPCSAISCYVCKSDQDSKCTPKTPFHEAVLASNCTSPNNLFSQWITNKDFMKIGIGKINLEHLFHLVSGKTKEAAELKPITACAYFYASTENKATIEFDKAASKVRAAFGDKKADNEVAVQRWVMRDCITMMLKEGANEMVNQCVPVAGTKDIATIRLCTCSSDKCNYPNAKLQEIIEKAETSSGAESPTMRKWSWSILTVVWSLLGVKFMHTL